jgi:WD40 repeat protein
VAATDYTTRLYRLDSGQATWLANLSVHDDGISQVAFGGVRLYVVPRNQASGGATTSRTIEIWDVANPVEPVLLANPAHYDDTFVGAIAGSPDGHLLAVVGGGGTASLWDVTRPEQPQRVATIPYGARITTVSFSPDGRTLLTGGDDGRAVLWDVEEVESVVADPIARACAIARPSLPTNDWARYFNNQPPPGTCPGTG